MCIMPVRMGIQATESFLLPIYMPGKVQEPSSFALLYTPFITPVFMFFGVQEYVRTPHLKLNTKVSSWSGHGNESFQSYNL